MKKLIIALCAFAVAILPATAQTETEIQAAKAMARSYGYSNDEINQVMNRVTGTGAANGQQVTTGQQFVNGQVAGYPAGQYVPGQTPYGTVAYPPTSNVAVPVGDITLPGTTVMPIEGRKAPSSNIYGHDFFISDGLALIPSVNAPVPASYVLGPGDEVVIDIWGNSNANYTRTIGNDSAITIQGVGPLYIGGMTLAEAEKHLKSKLATLYSGLRGAGTYLRISIGKIRGVTVYVLGEVYTPGVYTLPSLSSIATAIYMAGGVMQYGSVRNINLYRQSELKGTFDLYDYIFKGKYDTNLRLQDGDIISVGPTGNLAAVGGALNRFDLKYEMKDGETVQDLINYAGGFTVNAHRDLVHIDRLGARIGESFDVAKDDFGTFRVCAGDSLFVSSTTMKYGNRVHITGSVLHPGPYAISDNMKTLSQLINAAGGVQEGTYNARGYICRRDADMKPTNVSFSLERVLAGLDDIDLVRDDSVRVFSVLELQDSVTVSVMGEVNYPGDFEYRDGITLGDVILMAGGLTDGGDLANVEVASRGREDHGSVRHFNLVKEPAGNDEVLYPYDMVFIRTKVNYRELQTVTVMGEVKYPGTYAIEKNSVRLSDVIARASGFTDDAYVKGAILKRLMTDEEIAKQEVALNITQNQTANPMDTTILDVKKIGDTFTIGIDLNEAVRNPGSYADIILRSGDIIDVPQMNNTVKISGGVYFPNTVAYNPSYSWRDYVDKAGGFVKGARKSKTYAIYMDGSAAVRGSNKFKMEPGMEIVVPQVSETEGRKVSLAEVASLTSSVSSIAYMAAILINLFKK
ncbi:MAG: SLBB domain-containing protein [Bacteroidales bacterium]|nr:SLBB domain-containing protein [Bacteroidales bacterium]